jgi:hypothetical protein
MLHNLANNHRTLHQIISVENSFDSFRFEYQNIYDNVSMPGDEQVIEINKVIIEFGHGEVFKKKKIQYCT